MNKYLKTLVFLITFNIYAYAEKLECKYIYESITSQIGSSPFKTDSSESKDKRNLIIDFGDKDVNLIVGNDKSTLFYLSSGSGNSYFFEKTSSGNINLFSLYKDGTLTISKSFDVMGKGKMIVESILKCRDI